MSGARETKINEMLGDSFNINSLICNLQNSFLKGTFLLPLNSWKPSLHDLREGTLSSVINTIFKHSP